MTLKPRINWMKMKLNGLNFNDKLFKLWRRHVRKIYIHTYLYLHVSKNAFRTHSYLSHLYTLESLVTLRYKTRQSRAVQYLQLSVHWNEKFDFSQSFSILNLLLRFCESGKRFLTLLHWLDGECDAIHFGFAKKKKTKNKNVRSVMWYNFYVGLQSNDPYCRLDPRELIPHLCWTDTLTINSFSMSNGIRSLVELFF